MRKLVHLVGLLALGALLGAPVTADPAAPTLFTNCAAGGSSSTQLSAGVTYVMSVFDEETFVCFAATSAGTCAANGHRYVSGVVLKITLTSDTQWVSCRSVGATGDVQFSKG